MLRLHPRQPLGAALPALPQAAPPSAIEDDAGVRRLLAQSDNGTAAGPSGWGGNMLAALARSVGWASPHCCATSPTASYPMMPANCCSPAGW